MLYNSLFLDRSELDIFVARGDTEVAKVFLQINKPPLN